jgi:hypothetical protein
MARKKNYVNNKDLLQALIDYKKLVAEAEESGERNPIVPDYIGKCILLIATRLATKPNFSGYTYKEEMISDGIENCLQYIHNFNPDKSQNPFAYFTQIIWFAFLRRIAKEKKQMYIKFKASQQMNHENMILNSTGDSVPQNELPDYINEFVKDFEDKHQKKKDESKANKELKEKEAKEAK